MRIGIMLRAMDEKGGIGVYTRNIVQELLDCDTHNQYVLFYRHPDQLGRFASYANVTERWVKGSHKAWWDQVAVPLACRREQADVLFHPKFTAPLFAPCPVVMTVHGADWFMPEQAQYYAPADVRYIRTVMPWYFRKCTAVISVSHLTTENFNQVLQLPPDKVKTIYFAPARHFQRITETTMLQTVRTKYNLPKQFVLTLTKRLGDGRKNLSQIFKAYARYHAQANHPLPLVIGGKDCHLFKEDYNIPDDRYGKDILFPGWIAQEDLPAVYSLATLYLYPSNLEAFPIPLTEAMRCGTPIVTSNVNGLAEIAGEAAMLVNPQDTVDIAAAIGRLATDVDLQVRLSRTGLERAKLFSWDICRQETLAVLEQAATKGNGRYAV